MYDIQALRRAEFPHSSEAATAVIYFNHAGISPLPARTQAKAQWAIAQLAANPGRFWLHEALPLIEDLHRLLAQLINAADPAEIVPIASTGIALNLVAQAIPWQPGDNVIFCRQEFPSNAYPWLSLARDGVEARQTPPDNGGLTLAALRPFVDERTRVVAASAIQFFSGHRTDLAEIGAFCHERGIWFVVDAIQAVGHMPIDVQAMHIDVLASGGQKSLLALPGQGFLYVRDEVCAQLQPRSIHGNATVDYAHWLKQDLTPLPGAARFNTGTPNVVGLIGLHSSVQLLLELGIANIDQHTRALSADAIARLTRLGYCVITPADAPGPIVTFASDRSSAETDQLVNKLLEQNVVVVKHLDEAGSPYIRLSFHCYNTHEEVARFMEIFAKEEGRREGDEGD